MLLASMAKLFFAEVDVVYNSLKSLRVAAEDIYSINIVQGDGGVAVAV